MRPLAKYNDIEHDLIDICQYYQNNLEKDSVKKTLSNLYKKHTHKTGNEDRVIRYLGAGAFGKAYSINEDLVFKITTDSSEIEISRALIGQKNENIVDIYDVLNFDKNVAIIVQEKLNIARYITKDVRHFFDFIDETNTYVIDLLNQETLENVIDKEAITIADRECVLEDIYVLENLHKATKEIKMKTGMFNNDVHIYNIGCKKSGELALFDLSC